MQGTVKAVWDSLSMTIEASRSVPLMYTQLINPKTKLEFNPGDRAVVGTALTSARIMSRCQIE